MKLINIKIILITTLLMASACTSKKEVKPTKNFLKSISGLRYVEGVSEDKTLLAELNGIKVTRAEIERKSKVIQELIKIEGKLQSALIYRSANKMIEDKEKEGKEALKDSYDLKIFSAEPEEGFESLAKQLKLKMNSKIKLSFIEEAPEEIAAGTLGRFEGVNYNLENLEKNHIRYIEVLTQKYDESLKQVEGTITRKLLFAEAKKLGKTLQDLIENTIVKTNVEPTDEQVITFMKSKNISEPEITDNLKTSFKNILIEKSRNELISKYVKDKLITSPINFYMSLPDINFDINAEWSPIYGSETASNSMYFFTNPNCSSCKVTKDNIMKAFASSNFDLKMHTFFYYPDWDREARMFSEASMCVFLQDKSKFWDYTNKVIDFEGRVAEENLNNFVTELGVNSEGFKECFLTRKTKDIVNYHLQYADYLGISAQPTLIIQGKIYPGVTSAERLMQVFSNTATKKISKPSFLARIIDYFKGIFS